jgi:hypothetical protein
MFGLGKKVYPAVMPDERQMFNMNREATAQNRRIAALKREANLQDIRDMSKALLVRYKMKTIEPVSETQGETFYPLTDAASLSHIARADAQRAKEEAEAMKMGMEDKPPVKAQSLVQAAKRIQNRRRSSLLLNR